MVAASAAAVGAAVAAAAFVVQRRNIQKKRRVGRAHANACYSRRSLLHPDKKMRRLPGVSCWGRETMHHSRSALILLVLSHDTSLPCLSSRT